MLISLIFIPIVTLLLFPIINNEQRLKHFSLASLNLVFLLSLIAFLAFLSPAIIPFHSSLLLYHFYLPLAFDSLNLPFVFLVTSLMPIILLATADKVKLEKRLFFALLLITESVLIVTFTAQDMFLFYLAFEASLIPMFIIIGYWGARPQKITATFYFFFYSLIGSLLMLAAILLLLNETGTTNLESLLTIHIDPYYQILCWLAFSASLSAKLPLLPLHIWLPQAHVEAPLAGSMILAGLLLKLGGFAYLKFVLPILPDATLFFAPLWQTLSVLGIIYTSLTTLRQIDLKRIIAYSSVAHMSTATIGIFALNPEGLAGSILVMVAHGYVSSGLFLAVTILYERHGSRFLKYYRGLVITMPIFVILTLFLNFASMAVPPTSSFIGELLIFIGTFQSNPSVAILAGLGVIFSAAYSLFLANRICFGSFSPYITLISPYNNLSKDISRQEFHSLFALSIYSVLFGVSPSIVTIIFPLHYLG